MKNRLFNKFILITCLGLIFSFKLIAQSNDDCLSCHSDNELTMDRNGKKVSLFVDENNFKNAIHGKLECIGCHKGFDAENLPHKEGKDIAKVNCETCHQGKGGKNDFHVRLFGNNSGKKLPGCLTCHEYHYGVSPSKSTNKQKDYCGKCHNNMQFAGNYHTGSQLGNNTCLSCHKETNQIQGLVNNSVHKNVACVDCHSFVSKNFSQHLTAMTTQQKADCGKCHTDIYLQYKESIHGISLTEGVDEAAYCKDCHGSHEIVKKTNPISPVNTTNLAKTCGKCHDDKKFVAKFGMTSNSPAKNYALSIHGKLMSDGNKKATCVTCHTAHEIKNRVQPGSSISSFNLPNTCVQCHEKETKEYLGSIHWIKAKKGIRSAPVCNDCHDEHGDTFVKIANDKKSKKIMQEKICVSCHEDPLLTSKYGLSENQAKTYQDSYHGLAAIRGDEDAARCIDCHNVHKILPKNNPESSVNDLNVKATCQKCHPKATDVFAKSYSHKAATLKAQKIEDFVTVFYIWMIGVVIGGMLLHNLVIFIYEMRKKKNKDKNAIKIPRFTKNEVIQHLLLLISFITLAITGFALKYPNSWWSQGLLNLGMTESVRQLIHRIAAVVMMATGLYHIGYLFATRRGRDVLINLIPRIDDIKDVYKNIMYYLHLSKNKPEFDKYDYAEKAEYWALIWGTIVMGVTGLFLWFPTLVGDWAPTWLIKVSETIHFYEAILATLAIIVWHWFFVIFHPAEYPMSFTWVDGKMTLNHYRHHHEKHFKRVLIDYLEFKMGKKSEDKLMYSTVLFTETLKKNNLDPDSVFENELNNDYKLREYVEHKLGPLPVKD
jgi:predicted CXXCH cytochrome family protein